MAYREFPMTGSHKEVDKSGQSTNNQSVDISLAYHINDIRIVRV